MKKTKKAIFLGVVLAISAMMVIPAGSMNMKSSFGNKEKDLTNLILHPMMKETIKLEKIPMSPNTLAKGGDIPVIATEDNDQNPAITTDGGSNVLIMGEYVKGVLDVDLGLRYSPNGGETWYPEEAILTFPIEETIESQPRIDYTGGTDFQAYGSNIPDPTGILHLIHFPDITDPDAVWHDDEGWTIWSLDLAGYYEDYDGIDACGYPYGEEVAPYPDFHGIITSTCIDSDTGLDTISLVYETEAPSCQLLYLPEVEGTMSGMTCDIDLSTGEYFEAWEWKDEPGVINDGVYLDHCYLEPGNPDWWQASWPSFVFEDVHNPDVKADGGNCYLVFEVLDPTYGTKDIMCAYSHNNGETFETSSVTETPSENEQFPAVTAIGETVTCTYTRNGNLYTSISEDGGVTWEESEEPLNDVSGSVVEQYHCADIASRYVAWTDDRGETNDIYFDTTEVEVPIIQITDTSGGFGIKATVANTGTADATDVSWTIDLEGGLVIIGRHSENTIPTLAAGEETTIKSGLVLGFGRVDITVTADGASATASGFVLGPFVLGVS